MKLRSSLFRVMLCSASTLLLRRNNPGLLPHGSSRTRWPDDHSSGQPAAPVQGNARERRNAHRRERWRTRDRSCHRQRRARLGTFFQDQVARRPQFRAASGPSSRQGDGKLEKTPRRDSNPGFGFATSDAIHYAIRTARIRMSLPASTTLYSLCLTDKCACSRADRRRRRAASARRRPRPLGDRPSASRAPGSASPGGT